MPITTKSVRWICTGCGLNNPGKNNQCDSCGGTKGRRLITIIKITPLKVTEVTGFNKKEFFRTRSTY